LKDAEKNALKIYKPTVSLCIGGLFHSVCNINRENNVLTDPIIENCVTDCTGKSNIVLVASIIFGTKNNSKLYMMAITQE